MLSRGLLTGSTPKSKSDIRNHFPRFMGDNLLRNQHIIEALKKLAVEKEISPAQLAIAWVLAKGGNIIPVIGARTRAQLSESLSALDVKLSADDLKAMESAIAPSQVSGTRYGAPQMKQLDSEAGSY